MNPIISVNDLVKYFDKFCAVDHVTFSVAAGKIFGFLGPNGAGKTTIIKMLTTILFPTSGSIRIADFDPATEQGDVRRSFGIVFQDFSVDNTMTAWENMELHAALYGVSKQQLHTEGEKLLKLTELWDRRHDTVKTFSGGMKRRLEIARALLHRPKILFLDEPTVGLDPQTRLRIWNYIAQLTQEQNLTVFFTTHYMDEAERFCDEIVIIDHGKIIATGTPTSVKNSTQSATLEESFITLTGREIRAEDDSAGNVVKKNMIKIWNR